MRIPGLVFAKSRGLEFKGTSVHLERAERVEPGQIEHEIKKDERAREIYAEFAQVAQTFLDKSQTNEDYSSSPDKVVLLNASHESSLQLVHQTLGFPLMLLSFADPVSPPKVTGSATLVPDQSPASNFLEKIDKFKSTDSDDKEFRQFEMSRDENNLPVLTRVKLWNPAKTSGFLDVLRFDEEGRISHEGSYGNYGNLVSG